jgi:glycosyltransferase involved in cell wall biosynthesis
MVPEPTRRRIGIVDQSSEGWTAGATYTRMLLHSLSNACDAGTELYFLSPSANFDKVPARANARPVHLASFDNFPGERRVRSLFGLAEKSHNFRGELRLRRWLRLADSSDIFAVARAHGIDVLLPLFDVPQWKIFTKTIGWIPDFQHVYMPEFFSAEERSKRDKAISRLAERADVIMLSSHVAKEHFINVAPPYAAKARVASFPSLFAFEPPGRNPIASQSKYNLPAKFALVANQFWAHKNHLAVVQALEQLKKKNINIPVVMTGMPSDHRDPSNRYFSELLQAIAVAGLGGMITILGQVPYADLIDLLRTAAVVIQPSRFEGWSTVVQDAKALGRPVICSDIPVHREQAPTALGFFPYDGAGVLAEILEANWADLQPGPVLDLESKALAAERDFAMLHGQTVLELCRLAAGN